MFILITIEALPGGQLPVDTVLSEEILRRLTPISELFGVLPQSCCIEYSFSKEEAKRLLDVQSEQK